MEERKERWARFGALDGLEEARLRPSPGRARGRPRIPLQSDQEKPLSLLSRKENFHHCPGSASLSTRLDDLLLIRLKEGRVVPGQIGKARAAPPPGLPGCQISEPGRARSRLPRVSIALAPHLPPPRLPLTPSLPRGRVGRGGRLSAQRPALSAQHTADCTRSARDRKKEENVFEAVRGRRRERPARGVSVRGARRC